MPLVNSEDFLPTISDFTRVSQAHSSGDRESFMVGRELLLRSYRQPTMPSISVSRFSRQISPCR